LLERKLFVCGKNLRIFVKIPVKKKLEALKNYIKFLF